LLKPDALRRDLDGAVRVAAHRRGMLVTGTRDLQLQAADLAVLWPQFQPDTHTLTLTMFELYLTSGPSRLLVVEGVDAVENARAVKREIRTRFGNHLLGSVVHTADTAEEARRQLALLLDDRDADRSSYFPAEGSVQPLVGAALSRMGLSTDLLRAECERAYEDFMAERLCLSFRAPCHVEGADGQVLLHRDDINTVDSYVAMLLALLPGLDLRTALRTYLQVDVTNAAPIVECASHEWPEWRARLHLAGLPNVSLWPIAGRHEAHWHGVPAGDGGVPL
jgi:nucleoside diphosphate kinase